MEFSRRDFLKMIGIGLAAAPVIAMTDIDRLPIGAEPPRKKMVKKTRMVPRKITEPNPYLAASGAWSWPLAGVTGMTFTLPIAQSNPMIEEEYWEEEDE